MPWPLAVVAARSRDWESREFDFILSIQRLNFSATNLFTDCDDKGIAPTASGKLTWNSSGDKIICFYFHYAALTVNSND